MLEEMAVKSEMHIKAQPFRPWLACIVSLPMCALGAVFTIAAAFEFVPFDPPEDRAPFLAFSVIWTVAVFWMAYVFLKMPTGIDVTHSGNITLRSPVRTITLEPYEITKITYADRDWMLHHKKGRLDLRYFESSELKPFLSWVVHANSSVQAPDELRIQ